MEKQDLKKRLKQEVESEASALERRVNTKKELASLKMPEGSYEELMERISSKENTKRKFIYFGNSRRRALATAAIAILVVTMTGLGANAARLYLLNVENRERGGKPEITIDTEEAYYGDIGEDEAYEKIEEEIGILALRLIDKPKGMELGKVYIDAEMGEAVMEFHYDEHILNVYENKQNEGASFNTRLDGQVIDVIETFYLGDSIEIREIDKGNHEVFYAVQLEYLNAYYYITSDISLEMFETILYGIIFKNN